MNYSINAVLEAQIKNLTANTVNIEVRNTTLQGQLYTLSEVLEVYRRAYEDDTLEQRMVIVHQLQRQVEQMEELVDMLAECKYKYEKDIPSILADVHAKPQLVRDYLSATKVYATQVDEFVSTLANHTNTHRAIQNMLSRPL